MEKFKNYIILICAFILIATILMSLIPNGSLKHTVRFAISVMLMGIVLSPVAKLRNLDINSYINEYTINNEAFEKYNDYAVDEVRKAVSESVADFAKKKNINIHTAEVTTENGKIKSIVIDKKLADYITEISGILGVPQEYIETSE